MKRLLPSLLVIIFLLITLFRPLLAAAQTDGSSVQPQLPTTQLDTSNVTASTTNTTSASDSGQWVPDSEVTFIGKNAARSGNLLDWTLRNYNWVCVKQASTNASNQYQCDDSNNPLAKFWFQIVTSIVVPLLFIIIMITATVIIITRGKSVTIMRFIPRFIFVIVLIIFSYTVLSFLYQFTDVIQGFFLRSDVAQNCPPNCISQKDLLYVGWQYQGFEGLKQTGDANAESAFMTLLLTKLTALTYFVMVGILLMRKIILWFFVIVSPVFPLLLILYPVRNTGKVWIGEFFRWLLYAPLFAVFLNGLVYMWRQQIPLLFVPPQGASAINDPSQIIYPTAVNILLGGPKQFVTPTNSINLTETFALYVVALIMLWVVILLPWILLQIFLDYTANFSPNENMVMKTLVGMAGNKKPPSGGSSPSPDTGAAISLPFAKRFQLPTNLGPNGAAKALPLGTAASTSRFSQPATSKVNTEALSLANMKLPTMRDIARLDGARYSNDANRQGELNSARDTLSKIANPALATSTLDRAKFSDIRSRLSKQSTQGNLMASSLLNGANSMGKNRGSMSTMQMKNTLKQVANPASITNPATKVKLSNLQQSLAKASSEGSELATSVLKVSDKTSIEDVEKIKEKIMAAKQKGDKVGTQLAEVTETQTTAPAVNRIQTVSKEDYDAVRDMWKENYSKFEVPQGMAGSRSEWMKQDIANIDKIIGLLSSTDKDKVQEGMDAVSDILPFLLVGGFSTTEIIAYLKAKQDAAKDTVTNLAAEEETQVSVSTQSAHAEQTMAATMESEPVAPIPSSTNTTTDDSDDSSPLANLTQSSNVSNGEGDILTSTGLKVPNITDLAKYETGIMVQNKAKIGEVNQITDILKKIASPTPLTNEAEKAQYTTLKEKLVNESTNGNVTAKAILAAASSTDQASTTETITLPITNNQQTVTPESFDEVRNLWKEHYYNSPLPVEFGTAVKGRLEWIKRDMQQIQSLIDLLISPDAEKKKQGLNQVTHLLPFILLGGFSLPEMIAYLKAKYDAAKETVAAIDEEESKKVSVAAATPTENKQLVDEQDNKQ